MSFGLGEEGDPPSLPRLLRLHANATLWHDNKSQRVMLPLDAAHQSLILARLANRLSLIARETYAVGEGVSDGKRLRAFNEAQNRILAQLERLLAADPERYPDDVFAGILMDQFRSQQVDPERTLTAIGMPLA